VLSYPTQIRLGHVTSVKEIFVTSESFIWLNKGQIIIIMIITSSKGKYQKNEHRDTRAYCSHRVIDWQFQGTNQIIKLRSTTKLPHRKRNRKRTKANCKLRDHIKIKTHKKHKTREYMTTTLLRCCIQVTVFN